MSALILWRLSYPHTCFSLVFPLFIAAVICRGRFRANMHQRRYWANYYLKEGSSLYSLVTGKTLSIIRSLIMGMVYTFSLATIAVLGGVLEIGMLVFNMFLVLTLQPIFIKYTQKHIAAGVADYASVRLLTIVSFTMTAFVYIIILLNTPIPGYIDPLSLENSLNAASSLVASVCPFINVALKGAQELAVTQWFYMVSGTNSFALQWLKFTSWIVFLGYSSLALIGMSLFSAEMAVYSSKISRKSNN